MQNSEGKWQKNNWFLKNVKISMFFKNIFSLIQNIFIREIEIFSGIRHTTLFIWIIKIYILFFLKK